MNKIINAALSAIYPNAKIEQLLELIHETPNPIMATEMLLGIYETPKIPCRVTDGKTEFTLVNIDEWRNQIYYSFLAEEKTQKGTMSIEKWKTMTPVEDSLS